MDSQWKVHGRDWLEVEKDERIGVGQATKHSSLQGGKGIPPKVYHYKRKVKPQQPAAAGPVVEQVVKALRDNPVRRITQAFPPDSAEY